MIKEAYEVGMQTYLEKVGMSLSPSIRMGQALAKNTGKKSTVAFNNLSSASSVFGKAKPTLPTTGGAPAVAAAAPTAAPLVRPSTIGGQAIIPGETFGQFKARTGMGA